MSDWLGWACGSVFAVLAILKLGGTAWCLVDLRRKWRAVPELWGIDWLDIVCRIERTFGVTLTAKDFAGWPAERRVGLTAGQLWMVVTGKFRSNGNSAPADGWHRFVVELSEALGARPDRVTPESRLTADLGMTAGLD